MFSSNTACNRQIEQNGNTNSPVRLQSCNESNIFNDTIYPNLNYGFNNNNNNSLDFNNDMNIIEKQILIERMLNDNMNLLNNSCNQNIIDEQFYNINSTIPTTNAPTNTMTNNANVVTTTSSSTITSTTVATAFQNTIKTNVNETGNKTKLKSILVKSSSLFNDDDCMQDKNCSNSYDNNINNSKSDLSYCITATGSGTYSNRTKRTIKKQLTFEDDNVNARQRNNNNNVNDRTNNNRYGYVNEYQSNDSASFSLQNLHKKALMNASVPVLCMKTKQMVRAISPKRCSLTSEIRPLVTVPKSFYDCENSKINTEADGKNEAAHANLVNLNYNEDDYKDDDDYGHDLIQQEHEEVAGEDDISDYGELNEKNCLAESENSSIIFNDENNQLIKSDDNIENEQTFSTILFEEQEN